MKAVRIHAYGGVEQLVIDEVAIPAAGPGELLLRVHAAGVNPVDWKIREGYLQKMLAHRLPLTIGWDVAGEIVALGEGVTKFAVGARVYSRPAIDRDGSYAEYMVVKADEVALIPDKLSYVQAAAVPLAGLTAWLALADHGHLQSGQKVLIHAGAGGVGSFAVQLAKLWGAEVYATCSTANVPVVQALGADQVIDYRQEDFSQLREIDLVLDTVGGEVQWQSLNVLKAGGRLISIVGVTPSVAEEAPKRGLTAELAWVVPNGPRLAEFATVLADGQVKPLLGPVLPLSAVAEAHRLSQSGRTVGKIVLQVA